MIKLRNALLPLLLVTGAGFVAASSGREPSATTAQNGSNPLEGQTFYVDPEAPAWLAWRRASGRQKDLLWKIAREPKNSWYGAFTRPASQFRAKVRRTIDAAEAAGQLALLTVLRAESTGCNPSYQGGGPAEDRATREWYDKFANALGQSRVVVAFEPDSLGTIHCHARSRRDDRIRLLRYGVKALAGTNAIVYIEAGAADWTPPAKAAGLLRKIGVGMARGFMLNATHYDWTAANIRHGLKISRRIGGKPFIINTAESGRGPVHYFKGRRRVNLWCNPGLRGLGPPPTTDTSHPKVDAYLYVNRPGYSQTCDGGKIGWHLPRALMLARYATTWERPPRGTFNGHRKRYPRSRYINGPG